MSKSAIERINEINKQRRIAIYRGGIVRNGIHYNLYIFILGPIWLAETPTDSRFVLRALPSNYYSVHISFNKNESPESNTSKYYCKSYNAALILAEKMKEDKGIEIVDFAKDSYSIEDGILEDGYGKSYSRYGGGPTGDLSDDFINDVLDGDPSMYWNID